MSQPRVTVSWPSRSLKRDQHPQDLLGALVFLASADSDFMTGQNVLIDGGNVQHLTAGSRHGSPAAPRGTALFPPPRLGGYIPCRRPGFTLLEDAMAVATANKTGNGQPDSKHNIEAMRDAYYARIAEHSMSPLWKVMGELGASPAGDALHAGGLALRRREVAGHRNGRPH